MSIILCKNCRYADTDGAGHFMCTDYSPLEADGECWPTSEMHEFHEGKASDVCASFLFEDKPKRKAVSGMRCWEMSVQYVGKVLYLPKLERDVKLVETWDGKRFVPERTAWKVGAGEPTADGRSYECLVCSECDKWLAPVDCDGPDDGPSWCEHCGARILGTLRCPKCGEVMWSEGGSEHPARCVACGKEIDDDQD